MRHSSKHIFLSIRILSLIFLGLVLVLFSTCKKRRAFNSEDGQALVDVTNARIYNDIVLQEVNDLISDQFFLRGKGTENQGVQSNSSYSTCSYIVDSAQLYKGIILFNYSGNICNGLKKEGQVMAEFQNFPTQKWKTKGAVLKVSFVNYKVTNTTSNQSFKFAGSEFITNETGGTWYELRYLNFTNVIHTINGNDLTIKFENGDDIYYNISRKITFTNKNGVIIASSEGNSSQGNVSNVECWGLSREGKNYTSQITESIIWNTKCTSFKLRGGKATVTVDGKYFPLNATYGTGTDGNPITSEDCPYGWKLDYSLRNKTKQRIFNY